MDNPVPKSLEHFINVWKKFTWFLSLFFKFICQTSNPQTLLNRNGLNVSLYSSFFLLQEQSKRSWELLSLLAAPSMDVLPMMSSMTSTAAKSSVQASKQWTSIKCSEKLSYLCLTFLFHLYFIFLITGHTVILVLYPEMRKFCLNDLSPLKVLWSF